ncbi:MAG: MFS transporter [Rhodobacter sp.]|nr:MFS transporter [Rhodobacter sp.]
MFQVIATSWALLLGMALLMMGNGLQATLMGVRGALEGFTTFELSIVTSAYFAGFLIGSRATPWMIRRVGHVRVFAALASLISAALILFPTISDPWFWTALRVVIGLGFSGVYVTAESWLNNAASNENRGRTLSAYMTVQMFGIVSGQAILAMGDPAGFIVFIIPSVLVSVSFAPILLSVSPTPVFETAKPMGLGKLFRSSPLTLVGMALLGGLFAALLGMGSVYATRIGLGVGQVSSFVGAIFVGSMLFQYPIGWLSDRLDRRRLILFLAAVGGVTSFIAFLWDGDFTFLLFVALVMGGTVNPLYSLLIAYLNDYLATDNMAAASGGLVFVNGLGAVGGPIVTGWLMELAGPRGFWLFIAILLTALVCYAAYRMTQRAAVPADETGVYVSVLPTASPVAVEAAQEWAIEQADDADNV